MGFVVYSWLWCSSKVLLTTFSILSFLRVPRCELGKEIWRQGGLQHERYDLTKFWAGYQNHEERFALSNADSILYK
jgi:hypothetical protein